MHHFSRAHPELTALYPNRSVVRVAANDDGGGWGITAKHNDVPHSTEHINADVIIWATGFRPQSLDILAPIAERMEWMENEPEVDHDFAVRWDGPPDHNIFVQNGARQQRGLADPNLSLIAWRSQRIIERMIGIKTDNHYPSFIKWSATPIDDDSI